MLRNGNIIPYHKSSQGAFAPFARYVWCLMESFCLMVPKHVSQTLQLELKDFLSKDLSPTLAKGPNCSSASDSTGNAQLRHMKFNCASKKNIYAKTIEWCKDFLPKGMKDLIFFTPWSKVPHDPRCLCSAGTTMLGSMGWSSQPWCEPRGVRLSCKFLGFGWKKDDLGGGF